MQQYWVAKVHVVTDETATFYVADWLRIPADMIKVTREFVQRIYREKVKLEHVSVNARIILK
jgi:hypothetical protein